MSKSRTVAEGIRSKLGLVGLLRFMGDETSIEAADRIEELVATLENERHEMNGLEDDYDELERKYEALVKGLDNCLRVGVDGVLQRPMGTVYLIEDEVLALLEDDDE